jgi:hypothetical protein
MVDPENIGDAFASGVDVHDYEDWLRLVWWVDMQDNHGRRRKVASIVLAKHLLPVVVQELRGASSGHGRETRRH